jgi:hypothetical protein
MRDWTQIKIVTHGRKGSFGYMGKVRGEVLNGLRSPAAITNLIFVVLRTLDRIYF